MNATSIPHDVVGGPALSAVVPCYNSAPSLAELHRRLSGACAAAVGDDYELVLVNDGSRDATGAILADIARRDPHVVFVELSRNHGHQLALTAGLAVCRGDRVLIIDDDLQDPPELLGRMMEIMDEGADVVYGQRNSRAGESWAKRSSASLFYRLLRALTETDIPLDAGEFRLLSRRALDAFLAMPERDRFVCGMVSWVGFRQVPLPYDRAERFAGTSNYRWRDMVRLAADGITSFSVRPLRLANYLCFVLALAALFTVGYAVAQWLRGDTVPGWTSVITVVLLLGSFQMMVLAVMCEYLGRLFMEAKRRPLFLIDRIVRNTGVVSADPLSPYAVPAASAPSLGPALGRRGTRSAGEGLAHARHAPDPATCRRGPGALGGARQRSAMAAPWQRLRGPAGRRQRRSIMPAWPQSSASASISNPANGSGPARSCSWS